MQVGLKGSSRLQNTNFQNVKNKKINGFLFLTDMRSVSFMLVKITKWKCFKTKLIQTQKIKINTKTNKHILGNNGIQIGL